MPCASVSCVGGVVSASDTHTMRWAAIACVGLALLLAGVVLPSAVLLGLGAGILASALTAAISETTRRGTATRAQAGAEPVAVTSAEPRSADPDAVSAPAPAVTSAQPGVRVPASLETTVVLSTLADAVRHIADPVAASLWLADEPTSTLRQVAAVGPMAPAAQPVSLGDEGVMARALRATTAESEQIAILHGGSTAESLWRFALPITTGEHSGVAAVDFRSSAEPDLALLPEVTAILRPSLAGALALHIARVELDTARTLTEMARDLSRLLDPDEVLASSLRRAMELSGAATGSIMLLQPDTGRLVIEVAHGLPDEVVRSTEIGEGEGIAGWVLSTRQPLLVEDLAARTPNARRHGVRSAVSVPIADDDGVLGVLNVGSRSFPGRFGQSHMRSIELLGRQTATALRNARAVSESRKLYFDTLKALALALETKDPYSKGGTDRVLEYADALGALFSLSDQDHEALRIAALLHDIGMAAVGEGVATSDRTLTTVERALLKMHPQIAAEILAEAPALTRVVPIVYHHHEWYDGTGYVSGLTGETIPLGARILAVADAYVAMTSDRPYRRAYTPREALRELADKAGTQFDPAVVDALRDILRDGSNRVPFSDR